MPERFVPPWAKDFTNDANAAWAPAVLAGTQIAGAITSVLSELPPITGITGAGGSIAAALPNLIPGMLPSPPPTSPPPIVSQVPGLPDVLAKSATGGALTDLEQAAVAAAQRAWPAIQPQLQQDAMNYLQSYVQQVLAGNPTPSIPNVTYDGQSLTKAAAKGHAWRTFLVGMSASAATAVLSAVGSQTNLDFFTRDGWIATGSIAIGTLVQTLISYVGRLQVTPEYEKQLALAPSQTLK